MLFWNHWNQESAGVAHRPVMFTSTFLGKNPLTSQTRRTFNRSRANLNGPIRNTFIVFCWNESETILLQGSPELLISLLYISYFFYISSGSERKKVTSLLPADSRHVVVFSPLSFTNFFSFCLLRWDSYFILNIYKLCVFQSIMISSRVAVGWLGISKILLWKHFSFIILRIVFRGHYLYRRWIFFQFFGASTLLSHNCFLPLAELCHRVLEANKKKKHPFKNRP